MYQVNIKQKGQLKFAIANGFVIGYFPEVFSYTDKYGIAVRTKNNIEQDVNDIQRALFTPIRPCCFVTAFFGGSHQSIHGNYQYFEFDQSHVGGVIDYLGYEDSGQGIFSMSCGRMTPSEREITRSRGEINTATYVVILSWFIHKSGHPGYIKSFYT